MQKFKFFTLAILAMLSVNFAWGDEKSFTITFNDNGSDGSTAVTNSNFLNQVTACADSINSVTTAYCYPGTGGLKISSNNNNGSFTITLPHELTITKVVLNVMNKNATTKTVTVGSTAFTTSTGFSTDAFIDMEFTGTKTKTDQIYVSLAGTANKKRVAYLSSMTIYHEAGSATPTITKTANLTDFTYEAGSGPSAAQSFTVGGSNLTANITVTAPTNFEVSKSSGSGYASSVTLTQSSGTVSNTTIYVRMKSGLSQGTGKGGNITLSSTGATSQTIAVEGTVTAPAVKYTVTFNAGSGTCSTSSSTEGTAGAGVNLPVASPSSACGTDGWTFAGWATASQAETTTAPTLYAANSNYKPSSDCTLYAVYSKTESSGGGATFTPGTTTSGSFTISSGEYYASGTGSKINGVASSSADNYLFTQISGNQYSIKLGDNYITYSSSTNLGTSSSPYSWTISAGTNGDWRLASETSGRAFIFRAGSTNQFGGYSSSNATATSTEYFDVSIGGGSTSTTTYNSNPSCATCANLINITQGTPSHGSFTLTGAGTDICADEPVTVNLSNITADTHYHATAVTTSATTGGGTPSAITDGSATVSNITASTTINVTFAEDTKVVVTLLNNNNPVNAGGFDAQGKKEYYTGETLGALPTLTSSDACDATSTTFMGWTSDAGFQKRAAAPSFVTSTTPVTGNMTLRAVWARAQ